MKSIIQFSFKELEPKKQESLLLPLEETTVKIHELKLGDGNHLFQIMHSTLNTLFDFSKSRDYQILYFDNNKNFIGASYAINRVNGNFLVQTHSSNDLEKTINQESRKNIDNSFSNFMVEE